MARLELAAGKTLRMRKPGGPRFTAAKQDKFFAVLLATCNVEAARRAAKVSSSTVYRHRRGNAAFRARWAEVVREAYAQLELMMLERMMNGTVKTVTRADGSTERIHEYPNAIALTLLRLHRDTAVEAATEHEPEDIDEVRRRLADKLARLRRRMEAEGRAPPDEDKAA